MAVNPYTLNHLYQNGILDYVPTDLLMGTPVGSVLTPMNNPYMNMAQQGALYQNYGVAQDSFHSSFTPAYTPNDYQSVSNSANSYVGLNNYIGRNNGFVQIGANSNAGRINTFNGYGADGVNAIGAYGNVGAQPNAGGINAYGSYSDVKNGINGGINKISSVVNNTPKLILGLIAGTIGVIGIAALFKRGKKPAKTTGGNSSLWSKLNPLNLFKKNK